MAGNNGGPWGGGGHQGGGGNRGNNGGGGRGPGDEGPQIPDIDELMKKGQDQLRVLMGGRGDSGNGQGGGRRPSGGGIGRGGVLIGFVAVVALWASQSFYTVKPEELSVELFLGKYSSTGQPGLNFAPWPVVTKEVVPVTREQNEDIGVGARGSDAGLMLTGDENIVDIDFQVVWNINDPAEYLFNLRDPRTT
ncbi:MAG: SPFH domain-containing protein, partial [Rhodobacteraceae bacterium]|nr:SPFH domain-containing protein [Paracoccaceae bacterium]